jgi:hypothetical protein
MVILGKVHGVFSNHICGALEQDGPNLKIWRTVVLSIPLHRMHTCTSHVHLHFQFVWIIKDKILQAKATKAIEKVSRVCMCCTVGMSKILKQAEMSGMATKVETPTHDSIRELVTWECKEHGVNIMNVLANSKGSVGRWNLNFWRLEQYYTNFEARVL